MWKKLSFVGKCSVSFNSFIHCQTHVESHNYKCYKCSFESYTQTEVAKHKEEYDIMKSSSESHECELCDKTFRSKASLNKHLGEHKESSKFHEVRPVWFHCT